MIQYILSILISTLLFTGLIVTNVFTDPFVTGKTFYFLFSLSAILIWLLLGKLFGKQKSRITYNYIDIFAVLFLLYGLLRALATPYFSFAEHSSTLFFGAVLVYFVVRGAVSNYLINGNIKPLFFNIIIAAILLTTAVQLLIGYLQLAGIVNSNNANFGVTGMFNNPGPYAIFIAAMLPFIMGLVVYKHSNLSVRIFADIISIAIMVMLPFTESRAGWLAALVGIAFLLTVKYNLLSGVAVLNYSIG